MERGIRDAYLSDEVTLPNAASTTVTSQVLMLHNGADPLATFDVDCELRVTVPALNSTILPAAVGGGSPAAAGQITVTLQAASANTEAGWLAADSVKLAEIKGGESGGSAEVTLRHRFEKDVKKFIRVTFATNSTATDASAKKAAVCLVF